MIERLSEHRQKLNDALEKKYEIKLSLIKQKVGDLFVFNRYVLDAEHSDSNSVPLGKCHEELCHFVQERATKKKKLVLIPRGHLKTKLITIGRTIQRLTMDHGIRVLIYSATWQMAVDILSAIQKQLKTCSMLHQLYGDITEGATIWSQDRIKLKDNNKREPSITAAGIDNNLVGGHYELIIMDDVVNRDNINTMDQMLKVQNRYKDALDLLEPNGEMVVIGTRWHDADLYGWILDPKNDVIHSYDTFVERAYVGNLETGEGLVTLWPQKFTQDVLKQRLREEGWSHFSAQYLNNPVPEEDAIFKRNYFNYYDQDMMRGKLLTKFLAIDPALTNTKDSDFTGMVVVGVDEFNYIYILDLIRDKLSPSQIIDYMFKLRQVYQLSDVGIESVAFQKSLAYSVRDDNRFKLHPFHISELKPGDRSKDQRIRGLQPLYESGKIFHNKYLPNNIYLEDELTRFPRSQHDDLIDALAYCLDFIYPAKQVKKSKYHYKYLY
jgi:predicted phage terminase large subunit-like protein